MKLHISTYSKWSTFFVSSLLLLSCFTHAKTNDGVSREIAGQSQKNHAGEYIATDSEEFQKKLKELESTYENSPEVLRQIHQLELKYPDKTGAAKWQRSGHQYTTYIVAIEAGVSQSISYELAYYTQFPDDEIRFSAKLAFFYPSLKYRKQIMAVLHSLHGGDHNAVLKRRKDLVGILDQGVKNSSMANYELGLIIHAYGDSYAHTTEKDGQLKAFGPSFGHLFHGHKPDLIEYNPEKYKKYTCELFEILSQNLSCMPEMARLHRMIDRLKTARNGELPQFEKYAVDLGFDANEYGQIAKRLENRIGKPEVKETIEMMEEIINTD